MKKLLIKIGGTLLDAADSRHRLAQEISAVAGSYRLVVVHGGGKQMTRYLDTQGVESRFVNGQRISSPEVIDAVLKILKGTVNAELVCAFRAAGASPVGLSGLDGGLVDAELLDPELQSVGKPKHVSPALLDLLSQHGYLPVVACLAGDGSGRIYNVNADQMAVACASGFGADQLIFLTDVEGVKDSGGRLLRSLTIAEARDLIESGVAAGGMRAKLEAAITALGSGVTAIVIAPGAMPGIVRKIADGFQIGTFVTA